MSTSPSSLIAAAASCQLGLQRIEVPIPLLPQIGQPTFGFGDRSLVERVETTGAFGANTGEAALVQYAQLP